MNQVLLVRLALPSISHAREIVLAVVEVLPIDTQKQSRNEDSETLSLAQMLLEAEEDSILQYHQTM